MTIQRPIVIGLTGGIACGKSTISAYIQKKGIPVIDGDLVARQIVEPGTACLAEVIAAFGAQYLREDGALDRTLLGKLVFSDLAYLEQLNHIMKPFLLAEFQHQIDAFGQHAVVFLDAALLLEDKAFYHLADTVWLVVTTEAQQLERLMCRNHYSEEEARQRIASQMCDAERRKLADVVIDNSGAIAETIAQVDSLLSAL